MNVKQSTVPMLTITGVKALDPIRVFIEDYTEGKAQITITCFSSAWVGYWGAMGQRNMREFFTSCDASYLSTNLIVSDNLKRDKSSEKYLIRIIEAVQVGLREVITDESKPCKHVIIVADECAICGAQA
jgi:hypothetical protein